MSERGSFVTEYFYCDKCFQKAKDILLGNEKYLCSRVIDSWTKGETLPIIAGKIGGSYPGEELHIFELGLTEKLSKAICHPIRIAVLAECGQKIFTVEPNT